MHFSRPSLFVLLIAVSLNLPGQKQSHVKAGDNRLILDNGIIHREISFDQSAGKLVSSAISFSDEPFNYLEGNAASAEFRFTANDLGYSGQQSWQLLGMESQARESGAQEGIVVIKGEAGVVLELHYQIFDDLPFIRKYITIINRGEGELKIESVDVEALAFKAFPTSAEYYTNYCRDKHIGPYEGDWDDAVIAMHLPELERGVVYGNEAPGVLKRIACYQDARDFVAGLTHADQAYPFRKWLKPGERYTTPAVFMGIYRNERSPYHVLNFELPKLVKNYLGMEVFKKPYRPVFVYNTWNPFRKNIDSELIGELTEAAEECGIREFIIDDGWQVNAFTDKKADLPWWYTQVGDYLVDKDKFADGLKVVFDDIKRHNMEPGLWLSIGSASTTSEVIRDHPEWFSQDPSGALANLHTPEDETLKTACMSTDWKQYIGDIILELEEKHGLTYTKLDFATVTSAYVTDPAISGCYADHHPGHKDHPESLIANYNGLFTLFDNLQKEAPDLFIDCTFETQGKLHLIDYAFLQHAEGNWLSNIEEPAPHGALRVRHLAWQRTPLFPASSLVIGNLRLDSKDLEFDLFSLLGTFPIMLGDIREVPEDKRQWLKGWSEWISQMQEKYDYLSYRQDLEGFGEPGEGRWDGWQRINTGSGNGGIVGVFRQGSKEPVRWVTVCGLQQESVYTIIDASTGKIIETLNGKMLESKGFKVEMDRLYQGRIFEITFTKSTGHMEIDIPD